MHKIITYIINHGTADKPISSKDISEALNYTSAMIRNEVNKARTEGIPICSCDKGYFYSEDRTEILNTIQSLMHRTIAV
jgi:biotin operon repressor